MAETREVTTRLTIDARDAQAKAAEFGAAIDKAAGSLEKLVGATGQVSQTLDNSAKVTRRQNSAYEEMARAIDPVYAAHSRLAEAQGKLKLAMDGADAGYRSTKRSAEEAASAAAAFAARSRELASIQSELSRGLITAGEASARIASTMRAATGAVDAALSAYAGLKDRMDPTARAYQALNAEAEALDVLLKAGRITVEQHGAAMAFLSGEMDKASGASARLAAQRAQEVAALNASVQAYSGLRERMDPTARAYREIEAEAKNLDGLLKTGLITVREHANGMAFLASEIDKVSGKTAQLAAIEAARAQQAAQHAQYGINSFLGVDQPVTNSASASASAIQEALAERDAVAKATIARSLRRDAIEAETRAMELQAQIDAAAVIRKEAQAIEDLKARIDPASAALRRLDDDKKKLDAAFAAGRLSGGKEEYDTLTAAITRHRNMVEASTVSQKGMTNAIGLTKAQMSALNPQINDIVSGLLMGQPPMMIFTQQIGQVAQALQAGGAELPKFTAGTLAMAGGVAAVGVGFGIALIAAAKFMEQSREVANANAVMGGAIGRSSDQLLALAERAAEAGQISVASAREQEAAYIRTGKIGAQSMEALIALSRDYAVAVGKDVTDAQKDLADLFADPVAGAKKLSDAYGLLSGRQIEHIRQLKATGQEEQARLILADSLAARTRGLGDQVGTLAQAWERVARAASNAFTAVGQATAPESTAQAIARLEEKRRQLLASRGLDDARLAGETGGANVPAGAVPVDARYSAPGMGASSGELATTDAALAQKYADRAREREMAARVADWQTRVQKSASADSVAQSLRPMSAEITTITEQITKLQAGLKEPGMMAFADDGKRALEGLQSQLSDYQKVAATGLDLQTYKTQQLAAVEQKYAGLVGPQYAAQKAAEVERINLIGTATTAAQRKVQVDAATTQVTAGQTAAIAQQNAQLSLSSQYTLESASAYLKAGEAAGVYAEALKQAKQEELSTGVNADQRAKQLMAEKAAQTALSGAQAVPQLEREAAARQKIADAAMVGVQAQQQAELAYKIEQATLKERLDLVNANAETEAVLRDVIERKTKAILDEDAAQRRLAVAGMLQQQRDQLMLGQKQLELMWASAEARALEMSRTQALIDLRNRNIDATSAEGSAYLANAEALAKQGLALDRANQAYQELERFGDRAFDALLDKIVQSGKATVSWADATKALAAEFQQLALRMAIINPLKNAVFGTNLATAGDFFGGGAANQNAANQNGMMGQAASMATNWAGGKALSWGADKLGFGSSAGGVGVVDQIGMSLGFGAPTITSGALAAGYVAPTAGGVAASGSVQAMQLANLQAVNAGTAGTLGAGTGAGAVAMPSLSGALGAAGAGAFGGALGGMVGTATNSKVVGGLSGAALGAGSAYLANIVGLSSLGGPIGLAIGAVVGGIMAAIGTQKATVGPNAGASLQVQNGQLVRTGAAADNGGKTDNVIKVADTLTAAYNQLAALGAKLPDGETFRYIEGGDKVKINGEGPTDINELIRRMTASLTGEGLVGRALQSDAVKNSADLDQITKYVSLAAAIDKSSTALDGLDKTLGAVQKAAFKATGETWLPMLDEFKRAGEMGMSAEYVSVVTGQVNNLLDDIANPRTYTETQTAVAQFTGQMAAMKSIVEKVNPELAKTMDAIQAKGLDNIYAKVRTTYAANMNSALGFDYRNQLQGVRDYWNANATDMVLAGKDPNALYKAQAQQIIDGLTDSQIDDVVTYFRDLDPVMASLADSLRGTTKAAKEAAAAQEAAMKQNAVSLRDYLDALGLSDNSSLSPVAKMAEAERQWNEALAKTRQTGDVSYATKASDALLQASKPVMVMGTEAYAQRESWINTTLKNLGHEMHLPGFRTGGSFEVGGWGGEDSTLVRFMATPGERVTITRPDQASQPATQTVVVRDNQDVVRALSQMVNVLSTKLDQVSAELSSLKGEQTKETNLKLVAR